MNYRLNRAIAQTGFCSRRQADELIVAGRVQVNGKVVRDFNASVDLAKDSLAIDGTALAARDHQYVALYKPRGILTTSNDEFGREHVLDLLPGELKHLMPVGRLDRDSEGLIILTNDGDLALRLTHPSRHVPKIYLVTVTGAITDEFMQSMTAGVDLPDGRTLPAELSLIKGNENQSTFRIAIREGRNRQIRRMCARLGYPVTRLVRVGIGELQLRSMEPGEWRHLTIKEIEALKSG